MELKDRPVVYLDSSDYSHMSDPRANPAVVAVRDSLLNFARDKAATFVYSGAHISEMAPLDSQYTQAASERVDLMVAICGRSTLISHDRLIEGELRQLQNRSPGDLAAVSGDGEWFPNIGNIATPAQVLSAARLRSMLDSRIKESATNRKQRRTLNRYTSNSTRLMKGLSASGRTIDLSDLLRDYPMSPRDAEVLKRYVLGEVSQQRADEAFLNGLRDPRWMVRWFAQHHARLTPVGEWVRGPAARIAERMKQLMDKAARLGLQDLSGQGPTQPRMGASVDWQALPDVLLRDVIERLVKEQGNAVVFSVDDAKNCCPGISTTIRVMISSLRNSFSSMSRIPKESDFADAVHAMYAPYVTIFRTDRYMAPIVSKQVSAYGTHVVRRLLDLPDAIEEAMARAPRCR